MNFIRRIFLTGMMLFALVAVAEDCGPLPKVPERTPTVEIKVVKSLPAPVLTIQSQDAKGILGGFEGGTVVKVGDRYHAFTTEMTQRWEDSALALHQDTPWALGQPGWNPLAPGTHHFQLNRRFHREGPTRRTVGADADLQSRRWAVEPVLHCV